MEKYGKKYVNKIAEYLKKKQLKSPFQDLPIDKRLNKLCKSRNVYDVINVQEIKIQSMKSQDVKDGDATIKEDIKFETFIAQKMILNKRYYQKILEMKQKYNLEQYVKDQINSMNYDFTQMKETVSVHFCNCDYYGKLNLIVSTGFIKVERRKDDQFMIKTVVF